MCSFTQCFTMMGGEVAYEKRDMNPLFKYFLFTNFPLSLCNMFQCGNVVCFLQALLLKLCKVFQCGNISCFLQASLSNTRFLCRITTHLEKNRASIVLKYVVVLRVTINSQETHLYLH